MTTAGGGIILENSTIERNSTPGTGGGLRVRRGPATVVNCVLAENEAAGDGGGIHVGQYVEQLDVVNSVVWGNKANRTGGGVFVEEGATVAVANSVIRTNTAAEFPQLAGEMTVSYSNVEGGRPEPGNIDEEPKFADPEVGDFHLAAGSPCIDAGDNSAVPRFLTTDADGLMRFFNDPQTPDRGLGRGPIVDMGAFEFAALSPCRGNERLRVTCAQRGETFELRVSVYGGRPEGRLTLRLDDNAEPAALLRTNRHGRASATIRDVTARAHRVTIVECGLTQDVRCH